MELTPQLLETQQFPEKWRGYDQDAVDEFLERVGVAVAELQDRLRSTAERVVELETIDSTTASKEQSAPTTAAPPGRRESSTDTEPPNKSLAKTSEVDASQVGRALILAQAAADAAIAEAKAEAALIVSAANEASDTVAGEARAKATTIESTAIQNADRLTSEADRRHAAATSMLDDADAHVAKLAQETVATAQVEAAGLLAKAKTDADQMRSVAAANAAVEAAESVEAVKAELAGLETNRATRQAEVAALDSELESRQAALAGVVGDLESLLGRVGSLGASTVAKPDSKAEVEASAPSQSTPVVAASTPTPTPTAPVEPAAAEPTSVKPVSSQTAPVEAAVVETAPVETVSSQTPPAETELAETASTQTVSAQTVSAQTAPAEVPVPTTQPFTTADTGIETDASWASSAPAVEATEVPAAPQATSEVIDLTDAAVAEQDELKDLWAGIAAPASVGASSGGAVVDDPFLAALRGPDRVEFDGEGEPDSDRSGFRRRRRTRRL